MMKSPLKLVSLLALLATILPSLLYFKGMMGHEAVKWITLTGTIVWFIATPLWMGRELPLGADEVEI